MQHGSTNSRKLAFHSIYFYVSRHLSDLMFYCFWLYRETIAEYGMEIGPLMNRLLSLMSQGLGLDKNRLQSIIGENAAYSAQAHYYPACSNPELTLGLRPHFDLKVLNL